MFSTLAKAFTANEKGSMRVEKVHGPSHRYGEEDAEIDCILERLRPCHWPRHFTLIMLLPTAERDKTSCRSH